MIIMLIIGGIFILFAFEEPPLDQNQGKEIKFEFSRYKELIKSATVTIFFVQFVVFFNQTTLETIVTPMSQKYYNWTQLPNSIFYASVTACFILWFAIISKISSHVQDRSLILFGHILEGIAFTFYVVKSWIDLTQFPLWQFILGSTFLVSGLPFLFVSTSSLISKHVSDEGIQGMGQGILSAMG